MDPEKVKKQAIEFFNNADIDKNGSIDFAEWSAATINKSALLNDKNLKECFKMFDRDGGGTISAPEVGEILGGATRKDDKIWKEIVSQVDGDENGEIDYDEFKEMM